MPSPIENLLSGYISAVTRVKRIEIVAKNLCPKDCSVTPRGSCSHCQVMARQLVTKREGGE